MILIIIIVVIIIIALFSKSAPYVYDNIEYVIKDSGRPGPIVGMIGSVHGNEQAGAYCLRLLSRELIPARGKYIMITAANLSGLAAGTRNGPTGDLNRKYGNIDGIDDIYARAIINLLAPCDLVIDLHEGWGWHLINSRSIGSTLTPSNIDPELLMPIINELNMELSADRQFTIRPNNCDISSALGCYYKRTLRPYLLVETSGQNNIQPIEIRAGQMRLIIMRMLELTGAIN